MEEQFPQAPFDPDQEGYERHDSVRRVELAKLPEFLEHVTETHIAEYARAIGQLEKLRLNTDNRNLLVRNLQGPSAQLANLALDIIQEQGSELARLMVSRVYQYLDFRNESELQQYKLALAEAFQDWKRLLSDDELKRLRAGFTGEMAAYDLFNNLGVEIRYPKVDEDRLGGTDLLVELSELPSREGSDAPLPDNFGWVRVQVKALQVVPENYLESLHPLLVEIPSAKPARDKEVIEAMVAAVARDEYLRRSVSDARHSMTESLTATFQEARRHPNMAIGLLVLPSIETKGFVRIDPYTGKLSDDGDFRTRLVNTAWDTLYQFGRERLRPKRR